MNTKKVYTSEETDPSDFVHTHAMEASVTVENDIITSIMMGNCQSGGVIYNDHFGELHEAVKSLKMFPNLHAIVESFVDKTVEQISKVPNPVKEVKQLILSLFESYLGKTVSIGVVIKGDESNFQLTGTYEEIKFSIVQTPTGVRTFLKETYLHTNTEFLEAVGELIIELLRYKIRSHVQLLTKILYE